MLRSLTAGIELAFAGSRANIARTILSCAGIVVGVGALVLVVTASDFGQRFAVAYGEANAGLPATFQVMVQGEVADREAFEEDLRRAGGQDISVFQWPAETPLIRSGDAVLPDVEFRGVDVAMGDIRRMNMAQGRWFTDADAESLVPVLVVNQELADALGDVTEVQIGTGQWTDVRVVGVIESTTLDFSWQSAYLLRAPATEDMLFGGEDVQTEYQVRIDPEDPAAVDPTGMEFTERLSSAAWRWSGNGGEPLTVDAWRFDESEMLEDAVRYLSWGLGGIAVITLTTGLLGVLNVGLVTVRERRRELATYRALGASRFTLFVAVVMESVVVSLVAGAIAVLGCWAVVLAASALMDGLVSLPAGITVTMPASGVIVGLGSAAFVGLLAGIIPAIRALRASVVAGLRE
jgi:putative ABC transport system permease protein